MGLVGNARPKCPDRLKSLRPALAPRLTLLRPEGTRARASATVATFPNVSRDSIATTTRKFVDMIRPLTGDVTITSTIRRASWGRGSVPCDTHRMRGRGRVVCGYRRKDRGRPLSIPPTHHQPVALVRRGYRIPQWPSGVIVAPHRLPRHRPETACSVVLRRLWPEDLVQGACNPGVFPPPFVDLLARGTAQRNRQVIQRVEHDCFGAKTRTNRLSKYWATNQDIGHGLTS
jgi:hypothetical protein